MASGKPVIYIALNSEFSMHQIWQLTVILLKNKFYITSAWSRFFSLLSALQESIFILLVRLFILLDSPVIISIWHHIVYSFRWFQHAAQTFVKVPFFGAVSYLTVAVTPFCIVFAVLWGVYRHEPFAWIGQDILVRIVLIPLMCSFWWNLLLYFFSAHYFSYL